MFYDRRKSIPEQTDLRQVSEDNHILPDEESKSDQVESDEEGLVQAPQKNVKNKEFNIDSEEKCA